MEGQEGHEWQEGHEGHEGQEGQEGHVHKLEFLRLLNHNGCCAASMIMKMKMGCDDFYKNTKII